nr:hypothetical protein [Tanacetum cinerariifolium]
MILESVKHGPLIWPTIEENRVTRTKKYAEFSAIEKIQADYDLKATSIILQGLPSNIYSLVNHHRAAKDLWEKVQVLMQDSGLTILVFKKGDDPIDAINKMMSFLSIVVTSHFPSTKNQLRNSYNPRQQATIHDGRVTVQPLQGRQNSYDTGHMARQCLKPKRKRDATWFKENFLLVKAQGNGKVLNEEELEFLADHAKAVLMANLSSYESDVLSEDAKKMMEAIEKRFGRNATIKKTQRNLLKQQYENFTASNSKMLDQTFDRLQKLIDTMNMYDLYKNLKVYEPKLKEMSSSNSSTQNMAFVSSSNNNNTRGAVNTDLEVSTTGTQVNTANTDNLSDVVIYAFLASETSSTQFVNQDLEQIHPDDLDEMILRWQMSMVTMRARRFLKKTGRKLTVNGNNTIGFDKTNVECYKCHKRGQFARECRALRIQDTKHKESTRRTRPVETSTSTALVSSDGLSGYDWRNFMPPNPDLSYIGLDEFAVKPIVENKSSKEVTKAVRKNPDAPIIEDWVLDDEEENMTQPNIVKKTVKPSIPKIEFVKPRQQEKTAKNIKKDNPQIDLQDKGVIDSRCSRHMTRNMSYLTDYKEINEGYVAFRGNPKGGKITRKGSGPDWLFDINALRRIINYEPIAVGTQSNGFTGTKACDNAGQARKEKEPVKLCGDQMDVKSAFLYGKIEEEVYVCQPPGFEDPYFPDKVYKVEKALYGLHQAPRAWYETLSSYLLENRFHRGKIDKTLFIKRHKGLQVKQKQDGIFISQDKYVAEILKKYGFLEVKIASTPIETLKPPLKDENGKEVDVHMYRSISGSLMYLTSSRPDIMFAVCARARYQVNPKATVKAKTITGKVQLQSLVDGKKVIITESTVRRDLQLEDDEAVNKEMDDSLERAATTTSSLEAEKDSGNINKTQSKETSNESSSQGTDSGSGPNCQETMRDTISQTSLKRKVKKLEKKQRSRTYKLKRLYKVGLTARVDSSDEASLGEDAFKQERIINDINVDEWITLFDETTENQWSFNDQEDVEMLFDVADDLRELFNKAMKRVNTFVDYNAELVVESSKEAKAEVTEDRFEKIKPMDYMDNVLLHNLKTMFEHHVKDNVWKNQQGYVRDTCPDIYKPNKKFVAVTPIHKKKTVRFVDTVTSSINIPKVPNRPLLSSTGVNPSIRAIGSKPSCNRKNDRISRTPSSNEKNKVIQIGLWYLDTGFSKHMTRDCSRLTNFVHKFLDTVKFSNDQVAKIMGYGDYHIGKVTISRVYYVEELGHNLFLVGQFCDSNLKVAFRKHTCFVHNLEEATKTKSWLWHRRLSHLNFGAINRLDRHDLVRGLPILKFEKDHLCSAWQIQVSDCLGPQKILIFLPYAQGNPQIDLQDKGVINSGCSRHMTGNMSYLTDYKEIDGGYVAFGGNLKGGKITRKVPRKNNMYSVDLKNIFPKGGLTCLFAKATSEESTLWHRWPGHLNFKTMNKLVKGNLVRGNQSNGNAGTKACDDACKAKMETVPEKDYILLPLWTADPPFSHSSKNSQDDAFQPSSDSGKKVDKVPRQDSEEITELEDISTFKFLNEDADDGAEVDMNNLDTAIQVDEVPRQDSEGIDQKKLDDINSTNNVNDAGTNGVNAVGVNSSNELPFNSEMPELEDISTFNFSNEDEDDGEEADMNNLNISIQVSPTPTTRIHKDHPFDHMIDDVQSVIQTRHMSKNLEEHRTQEGNSCFKRSKLDRSYAGRASTIQITRSLDFGGFTKW